MDLEFNLGCFRICVLNFTIFFTKFKEQVKRVERKNRDEFRKMMEEDVASGTFTAKTLWFDYCQKASTIQIDLFFCKVSLFCYFQSTQIYLFALWLWFQVKDSAPYHAVALNLSGSTPKELFEDVSEDLQRQVLVLNTSLPPCGPEIFVLLAYKVRLMNVITEKRTSIVQ